MALTFFEALTAAAERDVAVRLYFDKSQFSQHGLRVDAPIEALLAHPNVAARVKSEGVLMHLKAYVVDGKVLRTGSGNFSRPGLAEQDNDLVLIGDDFAFDPGVGVCGKSGQGVPVGGGQPSMKIRGLTVGGTSV